MNLRRAVTLVLLLVAALPCVASSPEWLRQAAAKPLPAYKDDVRGVQIYSEQVTRVLNSGEIRTTYRVAYKILRTEGRDLGTLVVHFDKETKLTSLTGWTIPPKGFEYEVREKEAIETALYNDSLYEDTRYKVLRMPQAEPGSVIGYEYEQRQRPYTLEDVWAFQADVPTVLARYSLILPAGWEVRSHWRNHLEVAPQFNGNQRTWELTNISEVRDEPGMPTRRSVAGKMFISFAPNNATRAASHGDWNDVGIWYEQLTAGRRLASPDIQTKARELTQNLPSRLEKMRALTAFVQRDIRYVAIEIGIGGYQPHFAQEVFANRYGDCKDKATLLSAMLREIGVDSYYVVAHTERGYVTSAFASINSFNHVVLAIRLPEDTNLETMPAAVVHKTLGKLLYFDPTDSITPMGILPPYLQANHGLLVAEKSGELVDFPLHPAASNQIQRTATLKLDAMGTLSGDVREVRSGANAASYRSSLLDASKAQRTKRVEAFLAASLPGYTLRDYQVENLEAYDQDLVIRYSITVPNYARRAGSLTLLRPRVLGSKADPLLDLKERKYPLQIEAATLQTDDFRITLPEGYTADELPPASAVSSGPVSYSSQAKVDGRDLRYTRTYRIDQVAVPLAGLEEWNRVNRKIMQDERSSVVIKVAQ